MDGVSWLQCSCCIKRFAAAAAPERILPIKDFKTHQKQGKQKEGRKQTSLKHFNPCIVFCLSCQNPPPLSLSLSKEWSKSMSENTYFSSSTFINCLLSHGHWNHLKLKTSGSFHLSQFHVRMAICGEELTVKHGIYRVMCYACIVKHSESMELEGAMEIITYYHCCHFVSVCTM